MDTFVYQLSLFLNFILSFFVVVLIVLFLYEFLSNRKKGALPPTRHYKFYGLFMSLSTLDMILFSLRTLNYLFLIWALFYQHLEMVHFFFFLSSQILFDLLSLRPVHLLLQLLNGLFLCFLLFSKQVFYQYLIEIAMLPHVVLLLILLGLFIFLYGSYFYLKDILFFMSRNKYVKKVAR